MAAIEVYEPPPPPQPIVLILSGALNPTHAMHIRALTMAKAELESERYNFQVIAGYLCPSSDKYLQGKLGAWAMPFSHRQQLARSMLASSASSLPENSPSSATATATVTTAASDAASAPKRPASEKTLHAYFERTSTSVSTSSSSSSSSASAATAIALSSIEAADLSWIRVFDKAWASGEWIAHHLVKQYQHTHPTLRAFEVYGADFVAKTSIYKRPGRNIVCLPRAPSTDVIHKQLQLMSPAARTALHEGHHLILLPTDTSVVQALSSTLIRATLDHPDKTQWASLVTNGWITQHALDYLVANWSNLFFKQAPP